MRRITLVPTYLAQSRVNCGEHTVKAILSSLGDQYNSQKDARGFFQRIQGLMLPDSMLETLKAHNVDVLRRNLPLRGDGREAKHLEYMLADLDEGKVILMIVGQGWGFASPHWISIWGHRRGEDGEPIFQIYDSSIKVMPDRNLPVGNTERRWDDLFESWYRPFWRQSPWKNILPRIPFLGHHLRNVPIITYWVANP